MRTPIASVISLLIAGVALALSVVCWGKSYDRATYLILLAEALACFSILFGMAVRSLGRNRWANAGLIVATAALIISLRPIVMRLADFPYRAWIR